MTSCFLTNVFSSLPNDKLLQCCAGYVSASCRSDMVSFNLSSVQEREVGIDFSDILYYPEVKILYLSLVE